MVTRSVGAVLVLMALVGISPAPAGAEARHRALVLGVSQYDSEDFRDLQFAAKDAEDLARVLRDAGVGGWRSEDVVVLKDASVRAADVKGAIIRLLKASQEGDFVLVFFSGHGFVHDGQTFLALADTTLESAEVTGLNVAELRQWLGLYGSSANKLLVLDACHSGAALRASKGAKGIDFTDLRSSLQDMAGDTSYMTSSGGGETSQEDEAARNGAFTSLLVRALRGEARNATGTVTLGDAWSFVRRNIKGQTPQQGGSLPTDIVLAMPAAPDPVPQRQTLLLIDAEAECNAEVDGVAMGPLMPGRSMRLEVAPGKHVVTCLAAGAVVFTQAVHAFEGKQAIVHVPGWESPAPVRVPARPGVRRADGMRMIRIPAARVVLGEPAPSAQSVSVGEYFIDETEVTWEGYQRVMVQSRKATSPARPTWHREDAQPVVNVSWDEAAAYCHQVGGRLPTEAEWELAARGEERWDYPWGSWPPPAGAVQMAEHASQPKSRRKGADVLPPVQVKARPAGSLPAGASPLGVLDMSDNVREWAAGQFSATGMRPVRGGSFFSLDPSKAFRGSQRAGEHGQVKEPDLGFRCVMDAGPNGSP